VSATLNNAQLVNTSTKINADARLTISTKWEVATKSAPISWV
jgi:hypothetical protein